MRLGDGREPALDRRDSMRVRNLGKVARDRFGEQGMFPPDARKWAKSVA